MPIGELAALATALSWSVTSLFFAEAARRIGALRVNLLRLPLALVFLSVAVASVQDAFSAMDGRSVAYLATSGVVGLVIGDLALFGAMRRLGARLAVLAMSLAPVFASIAGVVLLGEVPGGRAVVGMVVTLGGVLWVASERFSGESHPIDLSRGLALAVIGAAGQGVGLVLAKLGMAGGTSALTATWVRMGTATAAIWLLTAISGKMSGLGLRGAARSTWPVLLGGAFFGPFVGVWLSLVAARLSNVGVAATIMATTPVLVIPLVMMTEHYRPSLRALAGTVLTLIGVAMLFLR